MDSLMAESLNAPYGARYFLTFDHPEYEFIDSDGA